MTAAIGWCDANVGGSVQKRGQSGVAVGGQLNGFAQSWSKVAGDGDGSIYFIATIPADAIILSLSFYQDALAGLTSLDCGIFRLSPSLQSLGGPSTTAADYYAGASATGTPNSTPVDAGAIFESALDSHSGYAQGSARNLLTNIVVQTVTTLGATTNGFTNYEKKIWELLGFTDPKWVDANYALGIRLNTAGSAAGKMALLGTWVEG